MTEGIQATSLLQKGNEVELSPKTQELGGERDEQSFAEVLSNAIKNVDGTMKTSNQKVQEFVAGESDNVHDAMISMKRAQLSFEMMVEVRNKVVETYQEVSRMQI